MILWRFCKKLKIFTTKLVHQGKIKKMISFKLYRSKILITQNFMLIPMQIPFLILTIIFRNDISLPGVIRLIQVI